jgi:hypothetical protein
VAKPPKAKAKALPKTPNDSSNSPSATERQYWLMKAEPETRMVGDKDVAFSIDHLAAKTEPEPWDGKSLIRTPISRKCD